MLTRRIEQVEKLADRTSLLIVISDLHAPGSVEAVKRIRQRHDCLVIQMADPAELGRLRGGFMRAMEAETGHGFFAAGWSRFLGDGVEAKGRDLAAAGVEHALVRTDRPIMPVLKRALAARSGGRLAR
jgi:hypothetical protein